MHPQSNHLEEESAKKNGGGSLSAATAINKSPSRRADPIWATLRWQHNHTERQPPSSLSSPYHLAGWYNLNDNNGNFNNRIGSPLVGQETVITRLILTGFSLQDLARSGSLTWSEAHVNIARHMLIGRIRHRHNQQEAVETIRNGRKLRETSTRRHGNSLELPLHTGWKRDATALCHPIRIYLTKTELKLALVRTGDAQNEDMYSVINQYVVDTALTIENGPPSTSNTTDYPLSCSPYRATRRQECTTETTQHKAIRDFHTNKTKCKNRGNYDKKPLLPDNDCGVTAVGRALILIPLMSMTYQTAHNAQEHQKGSVRIARAAHTAWLVQTNVHTSTRGNMLSVAAHTKSSLAQLAVMNGPFRGESPLSTAGNDQLIHLASLTLTVSWMSAGLIEACLSAVGTQLTTPFMSGIAALPLTKNVSPSQYSP